ncbi:MAG TPA: peptidoglycan editing factor PgeF [Devosiaceae bacterium]|jgi:hypothetical protein
METGSAFADIAMLRHGFFGRRGGVSTGEYAALNVSTSTGDNPANVAHNRMLVAEALNFTPPALTTIRQVHSSRVVTLTEPLEEHERPEADALVTNEPGILLGILTADCTPILFVDPHAGVIGAAHAGWKGAIDGIVERTIDAMLALGAQNGRIRALIGPTISGPNYEVGPQFAADVTARNAAAASFITTPSGGREHFDLPGFIEAALRTTGLAVVERVGGCTYADPDHYFSHRYATHRGATAGRQIAVIGRL